jgi:hypothetical protein
VRLGVSTPLQAALLVTPPSNAMFILTRLSFIMQNLDDTFDDDKLHELFSEFGTITSAKVSREPGPGTRCQKYCTFRFVIRASPWINIPNQIGRD